MRLFWVLIIIFASSSGSFAQNRYEVVGDTLVFDTEHSAVGFENTGQLEDYDVNLLADYIFEHPEIKTLKLTSRGGFIPASRSIATILMEHAIDTVAYGKCYSACTLIFLAGKSRTLEVGGELGFHRQIVVKEDHKPYFEANQEEMGWDDEFAYFSYSYDDLTDNLVKDIKYMSGRGLPLDFILKAFSISSGDMWIPTQEELLSAKVITAY